MPRIVEICIMSLLSSPIRLRAPEPQDVDFLYELENDHRLWHVSQTQVPYSRFELEQYVLSAEKHDPFVAKQVRFIIELENDGVHEVIGTIDLFELDAINRRAEIGIVISKEKRGMNYAGNALMLCINYAFGDLNFHQLYCNIEQDNYQSLMLFEKYGFQKIGLKRDWNLRNGKWIDEVLMQKIKESL